jgi:flagellar biosynthesis/type III secretory pathway ATPase
MLNHRGTKPPAVRRFASLSAKGLLGQIVDGLVPCGLGQRLGIFAGSGVGKSPPLSMIARSTSARRAWLHAQRVRAAAAAPA